MRVQRENRDGEHRSPVAVAMLWQQRLVFRVSAFPAWPAMLDRSRSWSVVALVALTAACLPPRPGDDVTQSFFQRHRGGPSGCRWVATVADPDIRLVWQETLSDIGGHDRERGRHVCR